MRKKGQPSSTFKRPQLQEQYGRVILEGSGSFVGRRPVPIPLPSELMDQIRPVETSTDTEKEEDGKKVITVAQAIACIEETAKENVLGDTGSVLENAWQLAKEIAGGPEPGELINPIAVIVDQMKACIRSHSLQQDNERQIVTTPRFKRIK